jgi:hypothetical protein
MRTMRVLATGLLVATVGLTAAAGDKGKQVDYETGFTGYFVKNNAPVKDNPAYLVITDKKDFDQVFGIGVTMKKPKLIDPNAFESKTAVVVIKRGNALWIYEVQKVTAADGEMRVEYRATEGKAGSAIFATPLIVVADGKKYTRVVFVENGKEVAKVNVGKAQ